jgi:hypothetical protein
MGLLFMTAMGLAGVCTLLRISPWIWSAPLLVAFIFGFVFVVRHGDRIAVAGGSHGLPSDAQP